MSYIEAIPVSMIVFAIRVVVVVLVVVVV